WGISAAGKQASVPPSGRCSPQINSRRVVLPQPLGPTTASSSPGPARSETSASACTPTPRRSREVRLTPCRRIASPPRAPPSKGSARDFSSVCNALPPRALPHRFEGSAPGESLPGRHLSRPTRQPPWCLLAVGVMLARERQSRPGQGAHEVLELGGRPALERRAVLLVGGDHRIAVVPVQPWLRVQPER